MADTDQTRLDDQQPKAPEINYNEIHNSDLSDIATEWAEEEEKLAHPDSQKKEAEAGATPQQETQPQKDETKSVEEKPKEEVIEPEKPALDEEKLTTKIVTELVDKLAPEDATKQEKKDLKTKIADLQKKAEDEGRELTYGEALEFLKDETKGELKDELTEEVTKNVMQKLDEEVKTEQEKLRVAEEQKKAEIAAINKQWDIQRDAMIAKDIITKADEAQLFIQLKQYNDSHPEAPMSNLVEFVSLHFKPSNAKEPGADAPVNGARRSVTPTDPNSFSYSDIHNKSLEDIVAGN